MEITRRNLLAGLGAMALTGCGGTGGPALAPRPAPGMQPVANAAFDAWLAGFRARAGGAGLGEAVLARGLREAGYLPGVIERDRNQTEFTRTLEDYLAIAASDDRIATGRQMLRRHAGLLAEIEARYGVPPEVVTAIWGLESRYGDRRGDIPVVSATATLAFDGRRGAFFERQLLAALRILERGDTTPGRLVGSWAGAMGHTQFIPTTYQVYAVDFRGDGRRDIWSEDPTDALASAAAYLDRMGWRRGRPWGLEVRAPAGLAGARGATRAVADWRAAGVTAAEDGALPDHGPAALIRPEGPAGPAFLAFRNFEVLARYNNAVNYVIGVGHLADRLAGAGPLRAGFPPDAFGLTIDDRKALQRELTAAGFDAGAPDGVIGSRTRAAIEGYQRAQGLTVTGEPSRALLARLRG
ncbi:lytic murein transglycosylase [Rhodosalinus sp.]|uniref:lytic murein transglycosylase n=1 Tax=Rhodosalinus sp. TaxID=2047741 RepID=UPI00397A5AC8